MAAQHKYRFDVCHFILLIFVCNCDVRTRACSIVNNRKQLLDTVHSAPTIVRTDINSNNHNSIKVDIKIRNEPVSCGKLWFRWCYGFTTQISRALAIVRWLKLCINVLTIAENESKPFNEAKNRAGFTFVWYSKLGLKFGISLELMKRKIAENALPLLDCIHFFDSCNIPVEYGMFMSSHYVPMVALIDCSQMNCLPKWNACVWGHVYACEFSIELRLFGFVNLHLNLIVSNPNGMGS